MTITRRTISLTFTVTLVIVAALVILDPHVVFAQETAGEYDRFLQRILWGFVASVFGGLTWATGGLLDWAIAELVLKFGHYYQSTGLGVAINNVWAVVRDLFNLTFIFGLIYIGFRLILSNDSGAKRAIGQLVIAALFVNFSLFFTKIVIDFSNVAAIQVARLIYTGNRDGVSSISQSFGIQMGLSGVWGQSDQAAAAQRQATGGLPPGGSYLYIFGAMIIFVIAAFCFAVGAILLISRFIVLNFLMMFSPIMFAGFVFEPARSYSSSFIKKLLSQSFFAPAFLLMIYISLYVLGTFSATLRGSSGTLYSTLSSTTGASLTPIAGFLLGGGFLIGSILIAQKMGAYGADAAVKIGNNWAGKARSMATNGALALPRLGARQTVGRTGAYVDKKLKNAGVRSDSFLRVAAGGAADAKFGGSKSFSSVKKLKEEAEKNAKEARREKAREDAVDGVDKAIAAYIKTPNQDTRIEMERKIAGASSEQVNKLLGKYKDDKPEDKQKKDQLIANMSAGQFDSVMKAKDEEFNDGDKNKIAGLRADAIKKSLQQKGRDDAQTKATKDAVDRGDTAEAAAAEGARAAAALSDEDAFEKAISKASAEQLKVLGEKTLTENRPGKQALATHLSFSQIEDIKKSKDYTETEKERITERHREGLITSFQGAAALGTVDKFLGRFKDEEIAKLPKEIIGNVKAWDHFTGGMLSEMKKSFTQPDRQKIKDYVENKVAAGGSHPAADWFRTSPQAKNFV